MKLIVIIDCIDGYNRVFFFLRAFMAQFETAFVLFVVGNFSVVIRFIGIVWSYGEVGYRLQTMAVGWDVFQTVAVIPGGFGGLICPDF